MKLSEPCAGCTLFRSHPGALRSMSSLSPLPWTTRLLHHKLPSRWISPGVLWMRFFKSLHFLQPQLWWEWALFSLEFTQYAFTFTLLVAREAFSPSPWKQLLNAQPVPQVFPGQSMDVLPGDLTYQLPTHHHYVTWEFPSDH